MNYTHLTIEERICLREYYKKGYSYRKIAELLGRNVSTISRELRRNCTHMYEIPTYYPHTAQKKCNLRRSYCFRVHRREVTANVVAGANSKNTVRFENAVVQNDISLDR